MVAAPSASQLRDAGGSSILCLDSLQQLQLQGAHPLSSAIPNSCAHILLGTDAPPALLSA